MPHTKKLTISSLAVSVQLIERRIYLIRGQKVMIDEDLAELYGVPTKRLNEQVRRNSKRFPGDFMFHLKREEVEALRSQFATSKRGRGGRRSLPYVFTEQGVAMLSSVLNSERAIEVNIAMMRAFVKLSQMLETNEELNQKFAAVIRKLATHDKYFKVIDQHQGRVFLRRFSHDHGSRKRVLVQTLPTPRPQAVSGLRVTLRVLC